MSSFTPALPRLLVNQPFAKPQTQLLPDLPAFNTLVPSPVPLTQECPSLKQSP